MIRRPTATTVARRPNISLTLTAREVFRDLLAWLPILLWRGVNVIAPDGLRGNYDDSEMQANYHK